jgi:hypothetical protein
MKWNFPFILNNWLNIFIQLHTICGESAKVEEEVVMPWINRILPNIVDGFSPDFFYNANWFILEDAAREYVTF